MTGESIAEVAAGIADRLTGGMRDVMVAPTGGVTSSPSDIHRLLLLGLYEAQITPLGLAVLTHLISQGADHDRN